MKAERYPVGNSARVRAIVAELDPRQGAPAAYIGGGENRIHQQWACPTSSTDDRSGLAPGSPQKMLLWRTGRPNSATGIAPPRAPPSNRSEYRRDLVLSWPGLIKRLEELFVQHSAQWFRLQSHWATFGLCAALSTWVSWDDVFVRWLYERTQACCKCPAKGIGALEAEILLCATLANGMCGGRPLTCAARAGLQ